MSNDTRRYLVLPMVSALALLTGANAAQAHPHVWIDSNVTVQVENGQIIAIEHAWTFDEYFSEFILLDYDFDSSGTFDDKELEFIEDNAFGALEDFDYFTHLYVDSIKQELKVYKDFSAEVVDNLIVYHFSLPLAEPVPINSQELMLGIFDDSYYVDIIWAEQDPLRFVGADCGYEARTDERVSIYGGVIMPIVAMIACEPVPSL